VNSSRRICTLELSSRHFGRATGGPSFVGFAQTISACRVAFKLLINPQRPVDGGTFRTLTIDAPEGSIFRATEPAPCQWYFTPLGLMIDLFLKAMAPVLPEATAAAHYGDSMVIYVSGVDPRTNSPFLAVEPTPGGWGGNANRDGQDALINVVNGAFKDLPVEVYEAKFPVMIHDLGIRTDTGGPGKNRGGCGIFREYTMETDTTISLWFDRSVTPAWGLAGGDSAVGPAITLRNADWEKKAPFKVNGLPVAKGTTLRIATGGGGGYGPALERDPEAVARDVLDGYVSVEDARSSYGVVIRPDGSVDPNKTQRSRRQAAG
jgi:N-methylhydantoinase B